MQTVASLAERLDMSPDEAVEKLRYMLFEVTDTRSRISDEQCDLLIDIDDEPSIADEYRTKKLQEIEKVEAKTEAAAKKKAAAAAKKTAAAKKKEAAATPSRRKHKR